MENAFGHPSSLFSNFSELDWLSIDEAAVYLRMLTRNGEPDINTMRNLANKGRIPFYKPFKKLMFRRSDLQKLVETSRNGNVHVDRKIHR